MKVIRELPRDTLDLLPKRVTVRKAPRTGRVTALSVQLKTLFENSPDKVFLIDCESTFKKHPKQCYIQVALSRMNTLGVFPKRLRGYHTSKGAIIVWME